jgi:ribosomal protein S18 acetylase RimI-like enzyme
VIPGLPADLVARPLTWDDLGAVFELEHACETFDDGVAEIALIDVEAEWRRPSFDLATMTVGVFDDDRLVAYGEVFQTRAEAAVAPPARGRGLGAALLPWTWSVARADDRTAIGQSISDTESAARDLLERHGYERAHTSWILRIGLDRAPAAPELPPGFAFHRYVPDADDPQVFDVIETAFSAWPDREPNTFEDWQAQFLHRPEVRPELQVLVEHGEQIVGVSLNYDPGPDDEGWVQQLAVSPSYQGRGLGHGLLQESFRRFHALGRRACGLSTDSRTDALRLYEHVGMRVRKSYTHWTKQL